MKLFVSLTGAINALKFGKITLADLNGLFVLGCSRDHALYPGTQEGDFTEPSIRNYPAEYQHVLEALIRAEASNRVRWLEPGQKAVHCFVLIDELLDAHGCGRLKDFSKVKHYTYQAVIELCPPEIEQVVIYNYHGA